MSFKRESKHREAMDSPETGREDDGRQVDQHSASLGSEPGGGQHSSIDEGYATLDFQFLASLGNSQLEDGEKNDIASCLADEAAGVGRETTESATDGSIGNSQPIAGAESEAQEPVTSQETASFNTTTNHAEVPQEVYTGSHLQQTNMELEQPVEKVVKGMYYTENGKPALKPNTDVEKPVPVSYSYSTPIARLSEAMRMKLTEPQQGKDQVDRSATEFMVDYKDGNSNSPKELTDLPSKNLSPEASLIKKMKGLRFKEENLQEMLKKIMNAAYPDGTLKFKHEEELETKSYASERAMCPKEDSEVTEHYLTTEFEEHGDTTKEVNCVARCTKHDEMYSSGSDDDEGSDCYNAYDEESHVDEGEIQRSISWHGPRSQDPSNNSSGIVQLAAWLVVVYLLMNPSLRVDSTQVTIATLTPAHLEFPQQHGDGQQVQDNYETRQRIRVRVTVRMPNIAAEPVISAGSRITSGYGGTTRRPHAIEENSERNAENSQVECDPERIR